MCLTILFKLHENSLPSSSFIVFDSFEEEEFRETATHLVYAKSLVCIGTIEEGGGGERRRREGEEKGAR